MDSIAGTILTEFQRLSDRHRDDCRRHDDFRAEVLALLQQDKDFRSEVLSLLGSILSQIQLPNRVLGGVMTRTGDSMNPITPGTTATFLVTPTFSGAAFPLVGANASVTSSDTANFPVDIAASDPTGATIEAIIPSTAVPIGGVSEDIVVTWSYKNTDGVVATVTGTVTEVGIVDDVTGGTFARLS